MVPVLRVIIAILTTFHCPHLSHRTLQPLLSYVLGWSKRGHRGCRIRVVCYLGTRSGSLLCTRIPEDKYLMDNGNRPIDVCLSMSPEANKRDYVM